MKTSIIEGQSISDLVYHLNQWYANNPERYTVFVNGPVIADVKWILIITHIPTVVRLA